MIQKLCPLLWIEHGTRTPSMRSRPWPRSYCNWPFVHVQQKWRTEAHPKMFQADTCKLRWDLDRRCHPWKAVSKLPCWAGAPLYRWLRKCFWGSHGGIYQGCRHQVKAFEYKWDIMRYLWICVILSETNEQQPTSVHIKKLHSLHLVNVNRQVKTARLVVHTTGSFFDYEVEEVYILSQMWCRTIKTQAEK